MCRISVAILTACFGALPSTAGAEILHLACLGAGSANKASVTTGYAFGSNGQSAWGQAIGQRTVPFDDQVNIELNDDNSGRIRLPRTLLPAIHGGHDGWFEFKDVKRSDDTITGSAGVNFLNSPKVRLDRITGRISIDGKAGRFSGECQSFDPSKSERKF